MSPDSILFAGIGHLMVDGDSFGYIFIIAKDCPCVSQVGNMACPFVLSLSNEDKAASGSSLSWIDISDILIDPLA